MSTEAAVMASSSKNAKRKGEIEPKPPRGGRKRGGVISSAPPTVEGPSIRVKGAREHNLKSIDVTIPRDKLVVITGLSGSGKSSLAFDTIFAEGQRKYMESLSAYARQFLDQLKKPDIDEIEGIPPTIAIEQRSAAHNPRSTVATTTEIYDYLRLLFARCGTPYSWRPTKTKRDGTVTARSGKVISATSATQIVDAVLRVGEGTRLMVLAPVLRGKKGCHRDVLERLQGMGWQRARVDRNVVDLRDVLKEPSDNPLDLERYAKHDIDAVIDRIVLRDDVRQRLAESIEAALQVGLGSVVIAVEDKDAWNDHSFSAKLADPDDPAYALDELEPRVFSFNSPFGACSTCLGLGHILEFDEELVAPDADRGILKGGIAPWKKSGPGGMVYPKRLRWFCRRFGVPQTATLNDLSDEVYDILMHGTRPEHEEQFSDSWPGVLPMLHDWFNKTESSWVKDHLHTFQSERVCPDCNGDRLRIEALHVCVESSHKADMGRGGSSTVIGRPKNDGSMLNISELSRLTIGDAMACIEGLKLSEEGMAIAEPIVREVGNRLRFLQSVGLDYLSLDRRTATLSGGEAQRIRLATQVGSGLVGACYVLDEPTIGLHQRDNDRLIRTLRHLTDIGNTVLVVEHDEDMIRSADHVLDIGPGPGVHGGRVVAQGTVDQVCAAKGSLTGEYLSGKRKIEVPESRRKLNAKTAVVVKGAKENNLRGVDAAFPVGGIVCVTGVSGSGKSTLVNDILLKALKREISGTRTKPGAHTRVNGMQRIDRIIEVDQSPIGRTPRSNPATYTGVFDDIRKVFASTRESKMRGYMPGRFSFNVPADRVGKAGAGGRCESCQGQGVKKIEMHFLPDVFVQCEVCKGKRYNRETLEVLYKGKNISDVLNMTIEDACDFFEAQGKILRFVQCLRDVGLGYLTLGQPSTTLSGGEAQRVKLATELGKGTRIDGTPSTEHTLYVLDEPTTGLHFEDISRLVSVFDRLADAGNTLVVIEHNLDVIKRADWIIDLGPEGGDGGGTIVAEGTPETIAKIDASHTGRYLKGMLKTT
ncbi:MAG: excinuclease ABC subunit UvrA [Phycisphaerales bacterium]